MMKRWAVVILVIVPLVALTWAGCGGGGNGADPLRPEITEASMSPEQLHFTGGDVTIAATVRSEEPIEQVIAAVEGPDETQDVVLGPDGERYEGTFSAPGNTGDVLVSYTVTVTATSVADRTSAPFAAGTFTVQSVSQIPDPPQSPPGW